MFSKPAWTSKLQAIMDVKEWLVLTTAASVSDVEYGDPLWDAGIILCMCPANERRRYSVTSSVIGWAQTQNDPSGMVAVWALVIFRFTLHMHIVATKHCTSGKTTHIVVQPTAQP